MYICYREDPGIMCLVGRLSLRAAVVCCSSKMIMSCLNDVEPVTRRRPHKFSKKGLPGALPRRGAESRDLSCQEAERKTTGSERCVIVTYYVAVVWFHLLPLELCIMYMHLK